MYKLAAEKCTPILKCQASHHTIAIKHVIYLVRAVLQQSRAIAEKCALHIAGYSAFNHVWGNPKSVLVWLVLAAGFNVRNHIRECPALRSFRLYCRLDMHQSLGDGQLLRCGELGMELLLCFVCLLNLRFRIVQCLWRSALSADPTWLLCFGYCTEL